MINWWRYQSLRTTPNSRVVHRQSILFAFRNAGYSLHDGIAIPSTGFVLPDGVLSHAGSKFIESSENGKAEGVHKRNFFFWQNDNFCQFFQIVEVFSTFNHFYPVKPIQIYKQTSKSILTIWDWLYLIVITAEVNTIIARPHTCHTLIMILHILNNQWWMNYSEIANRNIVTVT